MKLHVNDKYRITSNSLSWNIEEIRRLKDQRTGEVRETWAPILYFPTFQSALKALYELQLRLSDATDFIEAAKAATRIIDEMVEALKFNLEVPNVKG